MRVIAGLYKGRILGTVKDLSVRPATDRVKQTVFDMLANRVELEGASVLDLFAGSGSLGIEALSRGAARAVFVEQNARAVDSIEQNLRELGLEPVSEIYEMDALGFLRTAHDAFDLVFADLPYDFGETPEIQRLLFSGGAVAPSGYALIEHAADLQFETTAEYRVGPEKRFGRTVVTFFQGINHNG